MIVLIAVYEILLHGFQFYRLNTAMNDAQRSALFLLASFNTNLQNAQIGLTYPDPSSPSSLGISYVDPFDDSGKTQFDNVQKVILWQAYGIYYLNPNGDVRLIRVKINPPTSTPLAPQIVAPSQMIPSSFVGQNTGKLIAQNISRLSFLFFPTNATKGFYVITVESGQKGNPDNYWIRVQTSVFPRN